MKPFILKNLFLFTLVFLAVSNHSYGMKEEETISFSKPSYQKMPFKLGFEFQEASRLCPWALEERRVQKKELFSFYNEKNQKLWHVVIDDGDVEFVTKPFTPKEKPLLQECIKTIVNSIEELKNLFNENLEITFEAWTEKINSLYFGRVKKLEEFKTIKNNSLIRPKSKVNNLEEWSPQFSPQITIQHPLEYSIPLYFSLFGFDSIYMTNLTSSFPGRD